MKNLKIFAVLFLLFSFAANAQKIGVVDTNYILNKLPQYKAAEERLSMQVKNWQDEIQNLQTDYQNKKAALENERVLLVGDQLKQRETEVADLDKKIKMLINTRFGSNGEINSARSNAAKPFQDQIWNAIKTVSEKNSLGIVLDKSNNISVIFLDKRYDYTDKVLDLLVKNIENTRSNSGSSSATSNNRTVDDARKMDEMRNSGTRQNAQPAQQQRIK